MPNVAELPVELMLSFLWGGLVATGGLAIMRYVSRITPPYARAVAFFVFTWTAACVLIYLDYRSKVGS